MLKSTFKEAKRIQKAIKDINFQLPRAEETLWRLERGYVFMENGSSREGSIESLKSTISKMRESLLELHGRFDAL